MLPVVIHDRTQIEENASEILQGLTGVYALIFKSIKITSCHHLLGAAPSVLLFLWLCCLRNASHHTTCCRTENTAYNEVTQVSANCSYHGSIFGPGNAFVFSSYTPKFYFVPSYSYILGFSKIVLQSSIMAGTMVQQGSVDWGALAGSSITFSVDLLNRISKANVEIITVTVAQAMFSQFNFEANAQKRLQCLMVWNWHEAYR